MLKRATSPAILLLLLAAAAAAGIRGPGKYKGVVVFDSWGTCYLYSGVYLMYVSEKTKAGLMEYEGRPVEIYAKEVLQPTNPGDGLIGKFDLLSLLDSKPAPPGIRGLSLRAVPEFGPGPGARFALVFENRGAEDLKVDMRSVAPTLLGEKDEHDLFSPSDGKSTALITRCELAAPRGCLDEYGVTLKGPGGLETTETRRYAFRVEGGNVEDGAGLPAGLLVRAGQAERVVVALEAPPGAYDFLFGYEGGVHATRGLASNIVSFRVGRDGSAALLNDRKLGTDSDENSNP